MKTKRTSFLARAAMTLLVSVLTTATAWAENVSLQDDNGTKYVNMPATGTNTLTLANTDIASFKVYDNGGKDGNYSDGCNGTLVINAPTGYGFSLSGSVCTEYYSNDYLYAYDGNTVGANNRILASQSYTSGTWRNISSVTTMSESLTLNFKSDNLYNYAGLDLTVTLVGPEQLSRSTITISDHFFWNNGNAIDITYTVKDVNGNTLTKGTDYTETIKKGGNVVSDGVKDLGNYTLTITGTGSYSGEKTVNFAVAEENCLYGVISGESPNKTMTLKYGNYYDDPADAAMKQMVTIKDSYWWNVCDNSNMKTIVVDESCQNYQGTSLKYLFSYWKYVTSITGLEHLNYHNTVTDMNNMFYKCSALTTLDISGLNTGKVTDMNHMFSECTSLSSINFGDGTKFNTSKVTNMSWMFRECTPLTVLDISGLSTPVLSDVNGMFYNCSNLQTILVGSGWSVANVSSSTAYVFNGCSAIVGEQGTTYEGGETFHTRAHIDDGTSNPGYLTGRYTITYNTNGGTMPTDPYITTFTGKDNVEIVLPIATRNGYAFAGWYDNAELTGTPITSYPAGTKGDKTLYAKWSQALYAVISGTTMTLKCGDPTSETGAVVFDGLSTWNESFRSNITTAVVDESCQNYTGTTLNFLFNECEELTTITGLDNLNTENVTDMFGTFAICKKLTSVDVSKFNTSNVTDMSYMFEYCYALTTLDVSSFNTDKVTSMMGLFLLCKNLTTIDIRNFNTSEVKYMDYMFELCDQLTTIIVGEGWSTAKVTSSEEMFKDSKNLVGQNGTMYNSSYVDVTYARVDATGTPGYLTMRPCLVLADDASNDAAIANHNGDAIAVTLDGRTLTKNGSWNTLCLPFALSAEQIAASPLASATIKELNGTTSGLSGSTLTLNFTTAYDPTDAPTGSIVAGKPYIVKWPYDDTPYYISEVPTYDSGVSVISNEGPGKLVDGNTGTKYFMNADAWVEFHYASAITPKGYALWTAHDENGTRNPASWTIKAKNSGDSGWTTLVTVDNSAGDKLPMANDTRTVFTLDNSTAYQYFRFEATPSNSDPNKGQFQLAELQFYTVQPTPDNIFNPTFDNVTIDATASTEVASTDGTVTFKGTYSPVSWDTENKSILYLGAANTLYWPQPASTPVTLNACRAYFDLGTANAREFVLNFDGSVTGVKEVREVKEVNDNSWYTINGVRLNAKPNKPGLYINNGKKVVVK